ncbi:unnamed protein product, partial [Closterium sp. NIES-54]
YHMLQHSLAALAISGPTSDQQPPFQWSKSPFANVSHLGHPDLFLFPWLTISYGTEGTGTSHSTGTNRLSVEVPSGPLLPAVVVAAAVSAAAAAAADPILTPPAAFNAPPILAAAATDPANAARTITPIFGAMVENLEVSAGRRKHESNGVKHSELTTAANSATIWVILTLNCQLLASTSRHTIDSPRCQSPPRGGASRKIPASTSARGKASPAAAASPASQRGLSDSPSVAEVPIAASPLALPGKSPAKSPGGPAAVDGSPGQTGRQLRSQKPGESPSLPNGGSPKPRGRKRGSSDGEKDAKRRKSGEKGKGDWSLAHDSLAPLPSLPTTAASPAGKAAAAAAAKAVASPAARKAGKAGKAGTEGEAGKEGEEEKGGEGGEAEETVKQEDADEAAEREDEGDADEEQGGSGEESPAGGEQQRRGARRARGGGRGGAGGASSGAGARGRGRGARGRGGKAGAGLVSPDRPMSPGGAAGAGKGRGPRKRSPAPPDGEAGGAGKGGRGGGAAGGAGRGGEELQEVVHEAGAAGSAIVRDEKALDSVVKVFCVHTDPNFSLPWQRKRQY